MTDRTCDAIYELLYDAADEVLEEQVLDPIRELGIDPNDLDTDSIDELRSTIRGYALDKIEGLLERALDTYDGKMLVDGINDNALYNYFENEVGECYWEVEIRRRWRHMHVDGFTDFGTLDTVCSLMDGCLTDNEFVGDIPWDKLEAVLSLGGEVVAIMPNLSGPEYEVTCNRDVLKSLKRQ